MIAGVAERCLTYLETLFLNEINKLSGCLETLCNAMETLLIQIRGVAKIVTPPFRGGERLQRLDATGNGKREK